MLKLVAMVVFGALPLAVLGQVENCTIGGDFRAQDGDNTVQAVVTCAETGLYTQLEYSYPGIQDGLNTVQHSSIQLFYQCEDELGIATDEIQRVPDSFEYEISEYNYFVPLSSSFIERGGSCRVFGCYTESLRDSSDLYYPILTGSCLYTPTEPVLPPMPPTTPFPSSTTIVNLPPTSTTSNSVSIPVTVSPSDSGVSTRPVTTTIPSDIVLATATPSSTAIQNPTPTPVTSSPKTHDSSGPALPIILTISMVLVTAITIVMVVLLVVLLRVRNIQRKKNNILRYYNHSDPIDPDFNPVKSEVIQVFKPVTENVSVRSTTFHTEEQGDRRVPETDETDQEETKSVTKEPAVVEPTLH